MAMRVFARGSYLGTCEYPDWGVSNSRIFDTLTERYEERMVAALDDLSSNLSWMPETSEIWWEGDFDGKLGEMDESERAYFAAWDMCEWWSETSGRIYCEICEESGDEFPEDEMDEEADDE